MGALDYLGGVTANTRAKAARVEQAVTAEWYHPTHFWGYDPNPRNPEHNSRTAVDFMVFGNTKAGDTIADYLWENREQFGLKHLIWKQRIRSTIHSPGVWRDMADRGSPTNNHMDHVHAWFYDSELKEPPVASPIPNLPKPAPDRPMLDPVHIRRLQALLEVTADGMWGDGTDEWAMRMRTAANAKTGNIVKPFSVAKVQAVIDTNPDGVWGPMSQTALVAWVKQAQAVLRVTVDGAWGPMTDAAFMRLRTANHNKF